ncbi:TPR repeat domain protein [Desulforapulum autotrophicum HRM2]|uniref:TPR repeat domain protein n=1 Tax=Desulforapulum autotrophicum (strain ATCC 43914 / DSM 3382 / VKM B-1955 / HRM2) TaxID=177437 RepID=C0QLD0_DESAH|nr:tetratricopeptide repeat protein [Desulforapulum autotrophicum]ACN14216.1 TPR repeat domain protein [Desulforapulum autotrophicum HRM2]
MKQVIIPILICITLTACATNTIEQRNIAEATMALGEAHLNQGNYTAALKELLAAEKTLPNDPYLHNDLGITYMGKERFDLAENHFKRAVALKPDYIQAQNNLGAAYLKQKRYDKAIECYQQFSKNLLYMTPHFAFSNMGWAYLGKKDYILAEKNFSKALHLEPDFINAIHGLALTFLESGELFQAETLLQKKLKKMPQASILYADLAKTYEQMNQPNRAQKAWKQVLVFAPEGTPLALEAESRLNN